MFNRSIINEINQLKQEFRVLTIIGPRQAGKTTLCKLAFPDYKYLSLEDPETRLWAEEDPKSLLQSYNEFVIFDEIQRTPNLLSYIQGIVDTDNKLAQFILTGSHQLELSAAVSQSLAGRTALLTLLPLSLCEIASEDDDYAHLSPNQHLINGFMPGKLPNKMSNQRFYRAYFQTYVERDVRALIQLKDFTKFENFVRLCAGRVGQLLNAASIATDVGVSAKTISEWLSVLEASFIIYRLNPYYENYGKRIIKSSKIYFIDVGLAAWLLGIETEAQMQRDPLRGQLFENMVIIEALKTQLNAGKDPRLYFFRDSHGHEVDLLIQKGRKLQPVEIKTSATWQKSFTKGIRYFQTLAQAQAIAGRVIYSGDQIRQSKDYASLKYTNIKALFDE